MTANSQLSPGRAARALIRRNFRPLWFKPRSRSQAIAVGRIYDNTLKRTFDVTFSLLALVLCAPVYLILIALVALSSPGPVFYVQERIGKNYRPFKCYKFRTMIDNADELLEEMMVRSPHLRQEFEDNFKLKRDPRITPIGYFLRLTSLDELPQFWNVLMGEMSVVGPRPLVEEELPRYGQAMPTVLTIRPGITCIWQVSGRNDIPYHQRIQMDVHYVKTRNLWLDIQLIFRTIGVVVFPKDNGAY
jgi:lipopolysaccharide/colanic/teichoic acid biosynthesis glycosyltransferase